MMTEKKDKETKSRLPKSFGSIRYLGPGRKNPYAVHPSRAGKAGQEDRRADSSKEAGSKKRETLCYVPDWETGYKVLILYNAGKYKKGMERKLLRDPDPFEDMEYSHDSMVLYARKFLEGMEIIKNGGTVSSLFANTENVNSGKVWTFYDVYASLYEHKFGRHAARKLKPQTQNAYHSAWLKLEPLYDKSLDEVEIDQLEGLVYDLADHGYSRTTVQRVVTLIHQLYRYGYDRAYCQKDHGKRTTMPHVKSETHHQDFTNRELGLIWDHYHTSQNLFIKNVCRMILINCYSGFRIREYEELETIFGEENYFQGGLKTEAGKKRIVPIHSRILPLVLEIRKKGEDGAPACPVFLCGKKNGQFREDMKKVLSMVGIDGVSADGQVRRHTPHSCRHTFSRLCESYGVNEADRKRMMGHSLKNDVTNGVYGHRSIRELREQIEKIK